jgi:hypothetical protein
VAPDDLNNRFTYHPPNSEDKQRAHEDVRGMCLALAHELNDRLPEGREKALAITNLEQVMFWANAAIARDNHDQRPGR